jgi:hypothetical protein
LEIGMMKCPSKEEIVAYADSEIESEAQHEHIKAHLQSCPACQEWISIYQGLQAVQKEIALPPEAIPKFEMTTPLKSAITRQAAAIRESQQSRWWKALLTGGRPVGIPTLVAVGVLCLFAVGRVVWQLPQKKPSGAVIKLADGTYRVWGATEAIKWSEEPELPPALRSSNPTQFLGFLTPTLVEVLQHPTSTEGFVVSLTAALTDQEILLPSPPETLMIEAELFSAIEAQNYLPDKRLWLFFYPTRVVLIRPAEGD